MGVCGWPFGSSTSVASTTWVAILFVFTLFIQLPCLVFNARRCFSDSSLFVLTSNNSTLDWRR